MTKRIRFNPARQLVGRLFLGFWVTFIVTGLVTYYAVQFFDSDVTIRPADNREISALYRVENLLLRLNNDRNRSVQDILGHANRITRAIIVAVDIDKQELFPHQGPPILQVERDAMLQAAYRKSPIVLEKDGFSAVGPVYLEIKGKAVAVFVSHPLGPPDAQRPLTYFLFIALVMSVVLSYLFARSLVKPIHQLREASRKLAAGSWDTRVGSPSVRRDELGDLARDFNVMATQLERMWSGQQRLLADISHELRSPLARLQMALGLAHQQNVDPASLARIEREAERMEVLINQLLQLTRAEAGNQEMLEIKLSSLVENIFSDAKFEAANSDKTLQIAPIPEQKVIVNEILMCRAIENVVRNAIRYATSQIEVSINVETGCWELQVNDDGPGLSAEECESIFAPFYRASLARERESGGVGLGLAIAKAAVQLHHGEIKAMRNDNGGLNVTIRLPIDGREKWTGHSQTNTH
ncbi:ATP-binding protein [Alteromonas sp. C1M14]|uniref:ATP-binding protein n=1 Tax=Alteromonas sp. C1M14 TaxID=2841567 RepID=UPI001C086761|nr:ATP-binding protein [Alteromonas sp. C1M14]MBU2978660.1 HAMP domain-containing protein [Alteromonas sp. C1M14]